MASFLVAHPALVIAIAWINKIMIDQNKAKAIKAEISDLKAKLQEASKANNQKDVIKHQQKMLSLSNEQMRLSMKPMLVTFVIAIPVFVWFLPALYSVQPLNLIDGAGSLSYQGAEIPVTLTVNSDPVLKIGEEQVNGQIYGNEIKFSKDTVANAGGFVFQPLKINRDTNTLTAKLVVATLPIGLPIWGANLGWLGWYVLCSLPLGVLSRKILGVQ